LIQKTIYNPAIVIPKKIVQRKRHIMLGNLPPMKFNLGEKVRFTFNGHELVGIVKIADFGGSFEHDYHSYDIFAEDGCFYKHIPEEACRIAE